MHVTKDSSTQYLTFYRSQTTIDFTIHLSNKTGHFWGLCKIIQSSIDKVNHFICIIMINFHCKKYEHRSFNKLLRTWAISERHVIERYLPDNRHKKICFNSSLNDNIISRQE